MDSPLLFSFPDQKKKNRKGNEYRIFKLAGTTMGSALGRSEQDWKR
jgi:hypothetical protein